MRIRRARAADYEDVVAFTTDTWADRREDGGDYIPRVFEDWVESDGPRQRTLVADPEGADGLAGLAQFVLLSEHEAWAQGMRTNPAFRGRGVGSQIVHAGFDWAREQGATVARNMVFSWNVMGLGHSRATGFDPCTEFRWVHPEPDEDAAAASHGSESPADADAAWSFWRRSDASDALRGLTLAPEETWALRELTRADLRDAAADGDLLVTADDGTSGFALHTRTDEYDGTTRAEYGVAAWRDADACRDVLAAVQRDAAGRGVDETRVLVPEDVEAVSDVAVTRTDIGEEPDFVTEADLTADYRAD
ncbi:GNAT family N-acetyltransferase [Halocalculus aciditolerans]|uniref:N-acetyltransferase n=1 Tax=Halocalculus aciditolerans TaxID=1383812 RepID=A0A830F0U5_9EURY|nr:GNAT family N-acetyltransferase [Halocalculus aciditolerans]GGL51557.1 N-acetyltransferase [Halocalculus aciditolerans]